MESEKVINDQIKAAITAELFLSDSERDYLHSFCFSVYNRTNELVKKDNGKTPVELNKEALEKVSLEDQKGREIYNKWFKMALSAIDPENKPPYV